MQTPCSGGPCGGVPLVMGILNVTPDSFSDGGSWMDPRKAADHAFEMIDQGASIIDIGAESTRPGCTPIDADEEWRRLKPVLDLILPSISVLVSIDTMKADIASKCISEGIDIINDVSFLGDEKMVESCVNTGVALVVNHNGELRRNDFKEELKESIFSKCEYALSSGMKERDIIIDPGVGFGKTMEQNLEIAKDISFLKGDYPVLLGISRKSFMKKYYPNDDLDDVTAKLSSRSGADIVRVHNVKRTVSELASLQRKQR